MKTLIAVAILIAAPAGAQLRIDKAEVDKLRAELVEVETMTERFRRFVPEAFDLDEQTRRISGLAAKAGIQSLKVRVVSTEPKPPLEIHHLEVSGRGSYSDAHTLVSMLRLRSPLDSVRFDARDGGIVAFVARFSEPVWKGVDLPPSTGDPLADLRRTLDRRRAALNVMTAAVDRMMIHQSEDALADFTRELEGERVALTTSTVADLLTIEGLAIGSAARASVENALVKSKLEPARIGWSEKGRCHAFTIETAAPPPSGPEPDVSFVPGADIFDAASATFCQADATPPQKVVVKAGGPDGGALLLNMRGADVGHAFFILNDLFGEDFILDPDVRRRIDLDSYSGATLEDLFAGLDAAGIHVGAGPLRRVSTGKAAPIASSGEGEAISVSFQDASLSDVLCLMKDLAGREITMSATQQSAVRIFASELPAGLLAGALTPPRSPGAVNPCSIVTPPRTRLARTSTEGLREWAVADLRLVALAMFGGAPKAYFEVPTGMIASTEAGAEVRDGRLKAITPAGAMFDRAGVEVVVAYGGQ